MKCVAAQEGLLDQSVAELDEAEQRRDGQLVRVPTDVKQSAAEDFVAGAD